MHLTAYRDRWLQHVLILLIAVPDRNHLSHRLTTPWAHSNVFRQSILPMYLVRMRAVRFEAIGAKPQAARLQHSGCEEMVARSAVAADVNGSDAVSSWTVWRVFPPCPREQEGSRKGQADVQQIVSHDPLDAGAVVCDEHPRYERAIEESARELLVRLREVRLKSQGGAEAGCHEDGCVHPRSL